jgi:putative membrane protein
MSDRPYAGLPPEQLILRDRLAADRTILANERTFLAYVRTALTLFVAGVTFIHFFDRPLLGIVGVLFIPAGIAMLIIGIHRYRKMKAIIEEIKKTAPLDSSE